MAEALSEERQRSEAAIERAVESASRRAQEKMEDLAKVHYQYTIM